MIGLFGLDGIGPGLRSQWIMDTRPKWIRLHRKDIAYFKFIIESYEGPAILRTIDPAEAIVELMVAPGWEKDVDEILEGLAREIPFELLDTYAGTP